MRPITPLRFEAEATGAGYVLASGRGGRAVPLQIVVVLALLALGTTRFSFGQAVSGSIFGTVTDPSGAAVPGAAVTIRDLDRGIDY